MEKKIKQIINDVMCMSRATLEAHCVAVGVGRWGEAERSGVERQARGKSMDTLRMEHAVRLAEEVGLLEVVIRHMELPGRRCRSYQALGNFGSGPS